MRTSNPALNEKAFSTSGSGEPMTIQGTVHKTFISLGILFASAAWTWSRVFQQGSTPALLWVAGLVGFGLAIATVMKREWAPVTTPLYAIAEGTFLGAISAMFEAAYPGIVFQAISLTLGTLFALLVAYQSGLIKATDKFRSGVMAATGGIFVVYLINMVMSLFGAQIPFIHQSGFFGIGFSLFVVVIAALNLVLDFDLIERGASQGAPKYMEWYGAFALLVTLVWLYLEILRLLAKLQRR